MPLIVCDACGRHMKRDASECLFCGSDLIARASRPDMGVLRMRAIVFGALTAATAACIPGAAVYGGPPVDMSTPDAASPPVADAATPVPMVNAYGAAPIPMAPKGDQ